VRGNTIGPYTIHERLSAGGMAEVFRATESGLDGFSRSVAIKRILPHISAAPDFVAMFHDEAKLVVQLKHANIAQVYRLDEDDGRFDIALEYIEGADLREIQTMCRDEDQQFPIPHACYVVSSICDGLDYAHNKRDPEGNHLGLIHRDVSPPNVMVSYEGEVKLIDFGLAKANTATTETGRGILKGKLAYLSPEQARGEPIDARTDVFSAGIVLFEALTGARLFLGENDLDTLGRVRACDFPRPSSVNPKIPWRLEKIVKAALHEDPERRFQSAEEMSEALKYFMRSAGLPTRRDALGEWMESFIRPIRTGG
jgi:serine/threonine-protein kinase